LPRGDRPHAGSRSHAQRPPRGSDRVLRGDARRPQAARGTGARELKSVDRVCDSRDRRVRHFDIRFPRARQYDQWGSNPRGAVKGGRNGHYTAPQFSPAGALEPVLANRSMSRSIGASRSPPVRPQPPCKPNFRVGDDPPRVWRRRFKR